MMVVMTEEKEKAEDFMYLQRPGRRGVSYGLETHPAFPAPRPHTLIYLNHKNNTKP